MNEPPPIETETAALTLPADAAKITELRRRARRLRRLYHLSYAIYWISMPIFLISCIASWTDRDLNVPAWITYLNSACMVGSTFNLKARAKWRKTIELLTEAAGTQPVAALIEGLEITDEREFAMSVLKELLPRLQSSDAPLLSPRHHNILNCQLTRKPIFRFPSRTDFILATLKAHEQIGGTDDLPTVERLAKGEGSAKQNYNIRKAAQECLPYLQARSEGQDLRQTLLRASSESADSAANLLRPASAASSADPAQMLRASGLETPE